MAKTAEPGRQYIIVSVKTGKALTNTYVASVPEGNGVTVARRGLGATDVTINTDYGYIETPDLIPDNIIWNFTESTTSHPYPGDYTKANGFIGFTIRGNATGSSIGTNPLYRTSSDSTNTAPLRTDGTGDAQNSIWFVKPIDPATGQTAIFTYNSSNSYLLTVHGAPAGFVAEGGEYATLEQCAAASPVRLYEYVTN